MYSPELIKEVKRVYPDCSKIHELADNGNTFLGRYLDDSSQGSVNVDDILLATNLEEIQQKARDLKDRKNVYAMWIKEDPRMKY